MVAEYHINKAVKETEVVRNVTAARKNHAKSLATTVTFTLAHWPQPLGAPLKPYVDTSVSLGLSGQLSAAVPCLEEAAVVGVVVYCGSFSRHALPE